MKHISIIIIGFFISHKIYLNNQVQYGNLVQVTKQFTMHLKLVIIIKDKY